MKKAIKLIASLTLTAAICFIQLVTVCGAWEEKTYGKFKYIINGNTVTVTEYTGKESYVYIPDTIEGRYVSEIAAEAFMGNNYMEYVRLPAMLYSIDDKAFYECKKLKSFVIPNSVRELGENYIISDCTSLETIVMGDNILRIDKGTFGLFGMFGINSKIKKVSINANKIYLYSFNDSISDIYLRNYYKNDYQKNHNYHFSTKEDYNNSLTDYQKTHYNYPIDIVPLSKSHVKVTFDANGGKIPDYDMNYYKKTSLYTLKDQQISEEIPPVRTDHQFVGWYDNPECKGEPWNFPVDKVTKNITLYAKWKPQEYKVTFDACGGKADVKSKNYSFGMKMNELPKAKRSGYDFAGWYTRENCGGEKYNETSIMPKSSMTLYAGWIKKGEKLKVELNANGGNCNKNSFNIFFGSKLSSLPVPLRTGMIFVGWNTQKDGNGDTYTAQSVMDRKYLTLYAIWTEGKYTLSLDTKGGKLKQISYSYRYNDTITGLKIPKRTNYTFMGWYYSDGRKFSAR